MKSTLFIIVCTLLVLISCKGQTSAPENKKIKTASIGDRVSVLSKNIFIVFQTTNGTYWFGSDVDGVFKVEDDVITQFTTKDGLINNRIRGIQEDKQGNIYISTLDGICKFDGESFTTLKPVKENVWRLHPDDLWFSMLGNNGENGPYRYDGQKLYQLEFPKHFMEEEYFAKFPNKLWSPYEVYPIYKDNEDNMWFGTSNFGLCRYDGTSHSWLYEDHLTNTPNGGSFGIRSVIEDTNGAFWICNTNYRYTISEDSIKDKDKVLVKYKRKTGIEDIEQINGKDYVYFMSAVNDNQGNLWLATYDQGVLCYNGKSVKHYIVKDNDQNVTLFSIYKDNIGKIWLGTHESGTYIFNGKTFEKFI